METFLGTILIAAWAAVVLRGLTRTILAARKGGEWARAYLVGLGVGCAFGVGVLLSIKNSLPLEQTGRSSTPERLDWVRPRPSDPGISVFAEPPVSQ